MLNKIYFYIYVKFVIGYLKFPHDFSFIYVRGFILQ